MSEKHSFKQSNFELLRIVAMIFIVARHFVKYSGFDFSAMPFAVPKIWLQFIQMGGKIGVNLFIFITGYFLINSNRFKISKIIKLWLQVFLYSAGFYAVFLVCGLAPFSLKTFAKALLPVTYKEWWFVSAYFLLYIISPVLNKLLRSLSKSTYQKMLLVFFILWSVVYTFLFSNLECNDFLWFIYLYSVSAYIRLWKDESNLPCYKYHIYAIVVAAVSFLIVLLFDIIGIKISLFADNATIVYKGQSSFILLISIFMFLGFKNLKIKHSKIINTISSATFGVYLIHENSLVRNFIWEDLFKSTGYSDTCLIIPYSIGVIFLVYTACTIIELLRINLIEKYYMRLINKIELAINNFINNFFKMKIFSKL